MESPYARYQRSMARIRTIFKWAQYDGHSIGYRLLCVFWILTLVNFLYTAFIYETDQFRAFMVLSITSGVVQVRQYTLHRASYVFRIHHISIFGLRSIQNTCSPVICII